MKKEMSPFVRKCLIENPNITYQVLCDKCQEAGIKTPSKTIMYQAAHAIKKRYGVESLSDLPRKSNGEVNVSELIRIFFKKDPSVTCNQAMYWLNLDGFKSCSGVYSRIKKEFESEASPVTQQEILPEETIQPIQSKQRKPRKSSKSAKLEFYLEMEDSLEKLIAQANNMLESSIAQQLKTVRRIVSSHVIGTN